MKFFDLFFLVCDFSMELLHFPVSLGGVLLQLSGETEVESSHGCQVLELTLSHVCRQLLARHHNTAPKLLHLTGHWLQWTHAAMRLQPTPLLDPVAATWAGNGKFGARRLVFPALLHSTATETWAPLQWWSRRIRIRWRRIFFRRHDVSRRPA